MRDAASNNRAFRCGQASIIQNPISAIRSMGEEQPEARQAGDLLRPAEGPAGRSRRTSSVATWLELRQDRAGQRFLVDLLAALTRGSARASRHLPCFPRAVHDLPRKLGAREGWARLRKVSCWSPLDPRRAPADDACSGSARASGPRHAGHRRDGAARDHPRDVRARRARRADTRGVRARRRGGDAPHLRTLAEVGRAC